MSKEIWKAIPKFKGYEASSLGRIGSWRAASPFLSTPKRRRILKGWIANNGYPSVHLQGSTKPHPFSVHRLIALVFHGQCPSGLQVCHTNGNKLDNRSLNLRYDTARNNTLDSIYHETFPIGESQWLAKLKERDIPKIRKDKRLLRIIALDYGVALQTIHCIKKQKTWKHVA